MKKGNLKNYFVKSFSKDPKAKIILGIIVIACIVTGTIVAMRKSIKINIDGEEQTYITYKSTVDDLLKEEGIEISEKDKIEPALGTKIKSNQEVNIKRAVPVNLTVSGKEVSLDTAEDTVEDMLVAEEEYLKSNGIEFKNEDIVSPEKETKLDSGMDIKITKVDVEEVVETQVMPYSSSEVVDYDKDISFKEVTTPGINGEKEVTYKVVKHDGEIISKDEISQRPTKPTQDEVVTRGGSQFIASRGGEIKVKKKLSMQATAYSGHNTTATGRKPVKASDGVIGTIAVDPRVIPLGSLVYVSGYGKAIAADTGGAIKGNIIDVYLNSSSECSSWGRKYNIEVGIIAYPGEW